ncbi:glycosyltransferase family 2 protein [Conexibacter woesei]|uniref:Glycosyl transferase family 2 n=1 Tax=Conexibacter woesei (strain DSM 14684 / CCUG 47730 / CIP 108061 / JCM 11494 / NBRC 100937 / ID131577) TaxID=469383 RepID=D3F9H0_CONWI|nr:glycosyltransferase family A protein [Conexibacter woesei]ADB49137.1 glycosyl transferase family 2 [Conexibacter woesei DSM 14684]
MNLPLVSVLVTAHQDEDRVADSLDDALAQTYPATAIELIAVDDGSQDGTAGVLDEYARRHPGRVRVIRQPHAGQAAALDRALGEASGDVLVPLAAGDRWPSGRLAAQVALLERRPEVGLVYSELLRHDRDQTATPSLWPAELEVDPPRGRPVGRLLREDCVAPSSIAVRSALRPQLAPIPAAIPRAGWWLAVRAASVAEIEWLPEAPGPIGPEAAGESAARLRETLAFQRWFLRRTTSESPFVDELAEVWAAFADSARRLQSLADDPFTELLAVSDAERADARRILADARSAIARGDARPGMALAARAAATDPWCEPARALLAEALAARPRRASSDPLAGARRFVTLAFADELVEHPALLAAYGGQFDGRVDATLAIDASALTPVAAERALAALTQALGLDEDGTAHLLAVVGPIDAAVRERLPASVDALLSERAHAAPAAPAFGADGVASLRALAARASAA